MSLNKPLIEIVEEYLQHSSDPKEHELLAGIFVDNRSIKKKELEEQIKELQDYNKEVSWEHKRLVENQRRYNYHSTRATAITILENEISELKLYTLDDLVNEYESGNWSDPLLLSRQRPELTRSDQYSPSNLFEPSIRDNEICLHKAIRFYLEREKFQSKELERILTKRRAYLDYFRATKETLLLRISEESSFSELRSKIRHFAQSNVRNQYFDKLLSLAKTKEELFFVVKHGIRCPCWSKAVRKLAQIKDLSPIEKIN